MALDGTTTGLIASIGAYMHRTDLTAKIPDYIALAEGEMNRGILVRRQIARTEATISSEFCIVPPDFSGMRSFRLLDGTQPRLTYVAPEQMADLKDDNPQVGQPQNFTILGGEFEFYPVPDADYTAMISYYQNIPPLASNSTNWLLTSYPDVYLNGALKWAFIDIKDDDRASSADEMFQRTIAQINDQSLAESFPGALTTAPSGWVV